MGTGGGGDWKVSFVNKMIDIQVYYIHSKLNVGSRAGGDLNVGSREGAMRFLILALLIMLERKVVGKKGLEGLCCVVLVSVGCQYVGPSEGTFHFILFYFISFHFISFDFFETLISL